MTTVLPVTSDTVYTALYEKTPLTYTVTFRDEAGHIYSSDTYHYGDTLKLPADPQKAPDAMYTYTFAGWGESLSETVTDHATYVAQFTASPIVPEKKPNIQHLLTPGTGESSIPVLGIGGLALSAVGIAALLIRMRKGRRK